MSTQVKLDGIPFDFAPLTTHTADRAGQLAGTLSGGGIRWLGAVRESVRLTSQGCSAEELARLRAGLLSAEPLALEEGADTREVVVTAVVAYPTIGTTFWTVAVELLVAAPLTA